MKNIILTFLSVFLFTSVFTFSQVTQEWIKLYQDNSGAYVEARDFEKDISGNLIIAGYISTGNNADILLLKYNVNGQLLFSRQYDSTSEGGRAITTDLNGNIFVTGDGSDTGSTSIVLKYDSTGNLLWESTIAVKFSNWIAVDIKWNRNNVYVTGNTDDNGGSDIYLAKYNTNGNLQWLKKYNSPFDSVDFIENIQIDNSGHIYLCGNSFNTVSNYDYLIVKYDTNGNLIWEKMIDDGNSENNMTSSYIDTLNNIYLTGSSQGKFFTVKISSQGTEVWRRFYTGIENGSYAEAICGDGNDNIFITGQSKDSTIVNYNIATLKYNTAGDLLWASRFSGPGLNYDKPSSISLDNSNNIYVTGFITNSSNNRDFITLKYDNDGILKWNQNYNSSGGDESIGILCDNIGNVYVCGNSTNTGSSSIGTIKYSQPNGINAISLEIPNQFSLSQNYPNPFNPVTKIKFQIPKSSSAAQTFLSVYDVLGKEIATLVNHKLQPGTYEVDWNASNFPSGVYFYKLTFGSFSEAKRMVVLK